MSDVTVLIRCIEDLMDPQANPSSSEEKYRILPSHIKIDEPELIISVSTAESAPGIQPEHESYNGSVCLGGQFYLFDAGPTYDPKSTSHLRIPEGKDFLPNNVDEAIAHLIDNNFKETIEKKLIAPQREPAKNLTCIVDLNYVSIGVINIVNYEAYKQADPAAYTAFCESKQGHLSGACIETTHGLVKLSAGNIPTLFVSPITDRYQCFDQDVSDLQNYTVAFNAGVVVGEFLTRLNDWYAQSA
jgi:hypothetical protein